MSNSDRKPASRQIEEALPLVIEQVFLSDPVLTLRGPEWSLTIWCGWEAVGLDFGWETPANLGELVQRLVGRRITAFRVEPSRGPVFGLDQAIELVLDENEADEPWGQDDPWSLSLPTSVVTGGTRSPYWS